MRWVSKTFPFYKSPSHSCIYFTSIPSFPFTDCTRSWSFLSLRLSTAAAFSFVECSTYRKNAMERLEGRKEGRKEGRQEGEEYFAALTERLLKDSRTEDLIKATSDKGFREVLYKEYGIKNQI